MFSRMFSRSWSRLAAYSNDKGVLLEYLGDVPTNVRSGELGMRRPPWTRTQIDTALCESCQMARIIRATLKGPDARLGQVPAADVARVIIGLERALARAAYVALGTSRGSASGRHRAAIERASRLRFLGVVPGSITELLALPDFGEPAVDELPLTVSDLGGAAFVEVMRVVSPGTESVDVELASALTQLGDELGIGERNDYLSLGEAGVDPLLDAPDAVRLDGTVRQRMRAISERPKRAQDDAIVGTLVEADFERRTARLQPPFGASIVVMFPEEMADDIYQALRRPAELQGKVWFDPKIATARQIELRRVVRADQLDLDSGTFFVERTVWQLASEQNVPGPVADLRELSDPDLIDEERAAFLSPLIQS